MKYSLRPIKELQYCLPEKWRHALIVRHRESDWNRAGILFIHIPKAAGTSINMALYGRSYGHITAAEIRAYGSIRLQVLPSFAVTRNPWGRLVSAYHFATKDTPGATAIRQRWRYAGSAFATYERFVEEWLLAQDISRADYVFRPQATFIVDSTGKNLVKFVGRMEDLRPVAAFVEECLGRSVEFGHLNRTKCTSSYRSFYTKKLMNVVGDLYADDVKRFNYDF